MSTQQTILALLSEVTSRTVAAVQPTGNLLRDYGLSSLEGVSLFAKLERRFGLTFGLDPHDLKALSSLESLARWVDERLPA